MEILKSLYEKGYAILPSLLTQEECNKMVDGCWETLEHITQNFPVPMKRDDSKTWKSFYDLLPLHSMLVQHWGIGHAQFLWDLRTNPKILEVFSNLWSTIYNKDIKPQELLVSFDGASFNPPPEVTNRGYYRNNEWYHTDQSFTKPDFESIQTWVTAYDVKEGDATLTVLQGSHKFHKELAESFGITDKDDWYKINEEHVKWLKTKGCEVVNITCPSGSMVLWDSRLMHAGKEATKERKELNFRLVAYLCYAPRFLATQANLKKKQKAFEELRMTTHCPYKPKLFAKIPRTYGKEVPNVTSIHPPIIGEIGKKLAGF